jgi:hypothetical protein
MVSRVANSRAGGESCEWSVVPVGSHANCQWYRRSFASLIIRCFNFRERQMLTVLPNQKYGPYGAFNPYNICWMVVLVAARKRF